MAVSNLHHSVTIRLRLPNKPGTLSGATQVLAEYDGNLGAIDIIRVEKDALIRDLAVTIADTDRLDAMLEALRHRDGIEVLGVTDRTFELHRGGKIEVRSKIKLETRDQLARAYTPGVAQVSGAIHSDPALVYRYTMKANTVAVVTDGTAVLGMGDIGPAAAMPVMEGKAQLFREFAGLNAFPICLDTTDVDEIVDTVARIAPGFGGINLEDISAPRCFEIERRLKERLDIPVFHDDQHGTAVVIVAALLNALKLVGKKAGDVKVVVVGVGAAGTACTHMLLDLGVTNIVGVDRSGALSRTEADRLSPAHRAYAERTNPNKETGSLRDVLRGADVFIGLSAPNLLTADDLKEMAADPIVFAMANPMPEIMPEVAYPHVAVMATGRSDYPNQINNVLCFPGIFKGALLCRARQITEEMKLAAAGAIAASIPEENLAPDYIVPSVLDRSVVDRIAQAVRKVAVRTGVARP